MSKDVRSFEVPRHQRQTTGARAHAEVDRPVLVLFLRSFRDISRPYTYINLYIGTYYSKLYQVNLRGRCFNSFLLFLVRRLVSSVGFSQFCTKLYNPCHMPYPAEFQRSSLKRHGRLQWFQHVPAIWGRQFVVCFSRSLWKQLATNSAKDIRSRSCRDCRAQDMMRSWAGFISRLTWGADLKWFEACIRRTSWDRFLLFVIFRPPLLHSDHSDHSVTCVESIRVEFCNKDLLTAFLAADWDEELIAAILTAAEHEAQQHLEAYHQPHARLIMTYLYCLY